MIIIYNDDNNDVFNNDIYKIDDGTAVTMPPAFCGSRQSAPDFVLFEGRADGERRVPARSPWVASKGSKRGTILRPGRVVGVRRRHSPEVEPTATMSAAPADHGEGGQ